MAVAAKKKKSAPPPVLTDSAEQRALAVKQREEGVINPGDPDYDAKMTELWGGPPPAWFDKCFAAWSDKYTVTDKVALVTGSTGGIG